MPHIGTFRTFLFNWLFARKQGGTFVIRIEDTDRERLVPGAVDALLDAVTWFGLDWDEGPRVGGPFAPYLQSERLDVYHDHVARLIAAGAAYRCYCSPQRLEALRQEQQARKEPPGYDRKCRELPDAERAAHGADGTPSVVRFAIPFEGTTTFADVIHGDVTWENRVLDDFVILKSDGFPTYHLAHLVDDHLMGISHVLRGDEWISSTPRHVLLYQAFGWEPPVFAHLPAILGPDRKKLSKRHGETEIAKFRDAGYLPEALLNYLALCGWAPSGGEEEVLALDELVQQFSLERVNRTGAIFDHAKLDWFNGIYIRALSPESLADRLVPFVPAAAHVERARLAAITALIQDRLKTLSDAPDLTSFFLEEWIDYDAASLIQKGVTREQTIAALRASRELAEQTEPFAHEALEAEFRALAERLGLKTGQLFMSIRIACTGKSATPPLFETIEVLGRPRVLDRLRQAVARLEALPTA
jgi:glutamyl-tRNA synthetase